MITNGERRQLTGEENIPHSSPLSATETSAASRIAYRRRLRFSISYHIYYSLYS